ncbi:MAG TPA: hypothetical protein VIL78_09195 [Hanamia sp.]|jgi:hypothetical protein
MNGEEFLAFLHEEYANGEQQIPQHNGLQQYFFTQWLNDVNFQFHGTQNKSIPPHILIGIKDAYNEDNEINVNQWCDNHNFNPGGCGISVINTLLANYE